MAASLFVYFITDRLSDITILPAGLKPKPTTKDSAEVPRELSGLTTYTSLKICFIIWCKYERSSIRKNLAQKVPPSLSIFAVIERAACNNCACKY